VLSLTANKRQFSETTLGLGECLRDVEVELQKAEERVRALKEVQGHFQQALEAMERLSRDHQLDEVNTVSDSPEPGDPNGRSTDDFTTGDNAPLTLKQAIHDVLRGRPNGMHGTDILDQLLARGLKMRGRDPKINLCNYMAKDPDLERMSKGIYRLRKH